MFTLLFVLLVGNRVLVALIVLLMSFGFLCSVTLFHGSVG